MTSAILFALTGVAILAGVLVFVGFRRRAAGPVFPWIAPQAGIDPEHWTAVYWVAKVLFAIIPSISSFILTTTVDGAAAGLLFAVIGFFAPDVLLILLRRSRQQRIERSLSFFLDLMVSLLRAGLPVEDAFARAGTRGLPPTHPLGEEVTRTASDLNAGVDRAIAYRGLADRTGVRDLRPMTSALELGGRLGFGIADILGAQADMLRDKRLEQGRQRIDRTMVKALFPVMLCGLPLLLVVVVLPIVLDLGRTLNLVRALF